jgi:hypothetical protein
VAKRFAAHRPDLLAWIDSLADPPEPKWKRKQDQDRRKRQAQQAVAHASHRSEYLSNIDSVRAGEFRYVRGLAQAYLRQFRDIGDEKPAHQRIAEWVGPDIAEAAHKGFEAFLNLTRPRPSAVRIAIGHANGRRWYAGDIIVAGLAERARTRTASFEGLSSERLMAGLFELWRTRIEAHAKIDGLQAAIEGELKTRQDFECALRLYFEPQFKKRTKHVDHLYSLMRSEDYRGELRLHLAEDWLHRFPDMPAEPEAELIDALLSAGWEAKLARLAGERLHRDIGDERRRNWDAVQVITDFEVGRRRLERQEIEPALLWHLRARGGDRRRDERVTAGLSPVQIEWIVTTFRRLFPAVRHPSGTTSGDTNAWDATDYLRGLVARLGNDTSGAAVATMERLRDAPNDGYTEAFKIYAAEQRQARAEQNYNSPTLADLKSVIESGPPNSPSDLQAALFDALENVQARLKGDPLNWYRNFFRPDGRHKDEEECRDALLQMLDGRVAGVALRPEEHMADEKRVDIVAQAAPKLIVPVEVKGQWNRTLWTAPDAQLQRLYVNDWRAERGIYLVLWFGNGTKLQAPPGVKKPKTPKELEEALESVSEATKRGRVAVIVLDLTRPT